jgi:hypothetical protein
VGNSWSAFEEISLANLAIAILLIGGNLGELVYGLATRRPVRQGAVEYANSLTYNHDRELTIIVIRVLKVVHLLLYLRTLRPPPAEADRCSAAADGAAGAICGRPGAITPRTAPTSAPPESHPG